MLTAAIHRLESRFEEFIAAHRELKAENASLLGERDALLQERQLMRVELDRILARIATLDEGTS